MARTVLTAKPTSTQLVSGLTRVGTRIWSRCWAKAQLGFSPQYQRLPSDCIATVSRPLAQTLIQFVAEPTCTGTELPLVEAIPTDPAQLSPHAHRVPSLLNATEWMAPAAACFQSLPGAAGTGTLIAVGLPKRACTLSPQVQSVPSDLSARLWSVPAEMLTQLVSWPMRRKLVERLVRFPKPRTGQPRKSEPQAHRLPSEARMSPCLSPKLIAGARLPTGNLSPCLDNPSQVNSPMTPRRTTPNAILAPLRMAAADSISQKALVRRAPSMSLCFMVFNVRCPYRGPTSKASFPLAPPCPWHRTRPETASL